jgi:hypothetical protein
MTTKLQASSAKIGNRGLQKTDLKGEYGIDTLIIFTFKTYYLLLLIDT